MDEGKVLGKIRALLDKAGHPTTPEAEADACRERAEKLMVQYAIEEAELDASRPAAARMVPEQLNFEVCDSNNPISEQLCSLLGVLASHCRCKIVFYNYGGKSKYWNVSAVAVGYASDLRYLEMLYTSIYLHMAGQVEPTPDPARSFDENVYTLHGAGVKWRRIAELMNRTYDVYRAANANNPAALGLMADWRKAVKVSKTQPEVLVPWPDGHRLINANRRHCALIGEEHQAISSPVTWQRNFAEGYVGRIITRLYEMRRANPRAGTALALRHEDVKAKYNELFPPDTLKSSKRRDLRYNHEAQVRGRDAGDRADLSGGKNQASTKWQGELA